MESCTVPKSVIEVLSQEINEDFGSYRIRAGHRVQYMTIATDVFDKDTMCRPHLLISQLPDFPDKKWTIMEASPISEGPLLFELPFNVLPAVKTIWHPTTIDVLALEKVNDRRIPRARGSAHRSCLLGHVTENERAIGMLLEKLEGDFASTDDLPACEEALKKFHHMNTVHGDVNRYNFIMNRSKEPVHVRLVDFKHTESHEESKALVEFQSLSSKLAGTTGRGGSVVIVDSV